MIRVLATRGICRPVCQPIELSAFLSELQLKLNATNQFLRRGSRPELGARNYRNRS